MIDDANALLSETFNRYSKNWMVIDGLRQVVKMGMPLVKQELPKYHRELIDDLFGDPTVHELYIKSDGTQGDLDPEVKVMLQADVTRETIFNANVAVDAASIIFAHSILDDCLWSFCKACAIAAPNDWDRIIDSKKISFGELAVGKTLDILRLELIDDKLTQLEKESLLRKVQILLQLCSPPESFLAHYSYDSERLSRIDNARHAIIHRDALKSPIENLDDDLMFMKRVFGFFMDMIKFKYGIRLITNIVFPGKVE